jgi:hypothetical protein
VSWPPTAAEFYLELGGRRRPAFQGDIYTDVPFTKAKGGASPAADPTLSSERRTVATLSHPCDMYSDDGYRLRKPQAVVLVRKETGDGVPDDWDGCYHLCPLPDLHGDGDLWVADFTLVANIDRTYLTADRRLRCLSELGWTVFRQRAALESSRAEVPLEDLRGIGAATWAESLMEMDWLASGRDQASLQQWLNAPDEEHCSGFDQRRDVLQVAGGIERIRGLLRGEVGAGARS